MSDDVCGNGTDRPDEPLPFKCEYEIGVQECGKRNEWEHYHPRAKTTEEAKEMAKNEARRDGFRDPMVYMCTGPYRPENPITVGEEMIEEVFGPRYNFPGGERDE